MSRLRVCIAEDHETVRHGLRLLLQAEPDLEIAAEAADGAAAIACAAAHRPDVLVLDISMPKMNGLDVARTVKNTTPGVAIVVLSRHNDEAYVQQLFAAGVFGYVLKQSQSDELLKAIRAAGKGERYLDHALAARAADAYVARHGGTTVSRPAVTEREESVLRLIALGYSNKEIAARLVISVKTVEVHKANGMRKLQLKGRIDVVRYAVLNGWLEDA